MIPAYEVQVKEWAEQHETARTTFEMQHSDLDQEEAERVELTAWLSDLEHPQMLPPLADLYAAGEAALVAHEWDEALAQFETLSALDPNYRDVGDRPDEAHYLAGVAYLEAGQFDQALSELGQVALDYKEAEDKLASPRRQHGARAGR